MELWELVTGCIVGIVIVLVAYTSGHFIGAWLTRLRKKDREKLYAENTDLRERLEALTERNEQVLRKCAEQSNRITALEAQFADKRYCG